MMSRDVEHAEGSRWHCEEVDGDDVLDVVVEEGSPALRWRLSPLGFVLGNGGVADADAELGELGLDAELAPGWVRVPHIADQRAQLGIDRGPSAHGSALAAPVVAEAGPVPLHDGGGLDDVDGLVPVRPQLPQAEPKEAVAVFESRSLRLAFEHGELVAEREVFERKIAPRPKR
jgi:hypothetical protein